MLVAFLVTAEVTADNAEVVDDFLTSVGASIVPQVQEPTKLDGSGDDLPGVDVRNVEVKTLTAPDEKDAYLVAVLRDLGGAEISDFTFLPSDDEEVAQ